RNEPAILENVQFEFIGNLASSGIEIPEFKLLPAGLCYVKAPVAYEESLRLMAEADGLLVIDAPAETSVFLPSKLVDYIGAERPIFGITPPGTAAKLIEHLGGWVTSPDDDRAVKINLTKFIVTLRQQRATHSTQWGERDVRRRFEISNVVQSFS